MSHEAEKVLERWMEHVNNLEAESVAELYDETSTLLPTFSPHSLSSTEEIREYFRQLSMRKDVRVELHRETLKSRRMGEHIHVLTGIYSFHFVVDEASLTFPSRFTFVLDLSRGKPIIHHHSSQIPRTLS